MANPGRMTVLVVGATGSIGRLSFRRPSKTATPYVASFAISFDSDAEVVAGDLTEPDTLSAGVHDVDAIVFTHGSDGGGKAGAEHVDYGGVRNVLAALGFERSAHLPNTVEKDKFNEFMIKTVLPGLPA